MRNQSPPQPRGFVRLAHFEALRRIRAHRPDLYWTMSAETKTQLNFYMAMRATHNTAQAAHRLELLKRSDVA